MLLTMLLLVCAYFVGSIPFGLLFAKLLGKPDLRQSGSGNIGATNALRTGGKLLGILTLVADIAKGYLVSVWSDVIWINVLYGSAAVIGHIFPVWLAFRGGKGVATFLGVLTAIYPLSFIIVISVWILVFTITRYASLASLVGLATGCASLFFYFATPLATIFSILYTLIIYSHKDNIKRLLAGKEQKMK